MKPPDCNLQNQEKWVDELTDGLDVHRGIAVPRHMSLPGQDGWRTPTVHDYERERMDNVEEGTASKEAVNTQPLARFGLHTVSKIDLSLEKLYWRERIRHFTWTFFTMTMATGGIANVLHNGMSLNSFILSRP